MSRYALKFISGKYKGGEFPLEEGKEVIIGRSSDIDMVLVEDMVSRKHARLIQERNQITIEDLGSTNGSFVNGEKIQKATLKTGDRILIGTSIMKLIDLDGKSAEPSLAVTQKSRGLRDSALQAAKASNRSIAGAIDEVPLPDLIQLFTTSRKTGTLTIRSGKLLGKIYLKDGRVVFAAIDDDHSIPPTIAFYRMLGWETGDFELLNEEKQEFPSMMDTSAEHLLIEGIRQLDELKHLEPELPQRRSNLTLASPLKPRLSELKPEELDVLQLVHNLERVDLILGRSPQSDLDTARILLSLLSRGFLQVL